MGYLPAAAERNFTVLRFSSDDWPEAERRDMLHDFVARNSVDEEPEARRRERLRDLYVRNIIRMDVEPSPQCPMSIEAKFRAFPELGLAYITNTPMRVRRTPAHVVNDDLVLAVNLSGNRQLDQRGREQYVGEGEAILTSGSEICTTDISNSRFITFRLPRKPISALVTDLDDCVARPIRRDTQALRLLVNYAGVLQDSDDMQPNLHLLVTHVHDLVALALGAGRDVAHTARHGAAAARLHAIKQDIIGNLGRADLSAASVAARQRLPVRYMQRLFEAEGITFTEFVLGERLKRAHRLLSDPRFAARAINAIAFEVGFNHLSYFNRSFRARFGQSPSDARAAAHRAD